MPRGNTYTVAFTLLIAVLAAFLLSAASELLKERQQLEAAADMKRNILRAAGVACPDGADGREGGESELMRVRECYRENMKGIVIDGSGAEVRDARPAESIDLEQELDKAEAVRRYPLYLRVDGKGNVLAYCLPMFGKGLWSSIYGYLALKPDAATVQGVTFYKQGETPGLGAEVASDRFAANFVGKRILDEKGNLVSISVMRGKADPRAPLAAHQVDGISGATLTGKGVTALVKNSLALYMPYLLFIRGKGAGNGIQ